MPRHTSSKSRKDKKKGRERRKEKRLFERLEPRMMLSISSLHGSRQVLADSLGLLSEQQGPPAWALDAMRSEPVETEAVLDPATLYDQRYVQAESSRQVVFVDRGIADYETLIGAIDLGRGSLSDNGIDIVLLDEDENGIAKISDYLRNTGNVGGIHILSHGSAGSLQLGNVRLDGDTLDDYADELGRWREALADHADILLYGCNVAEGEWGVSFVEDFSAVTGADVAASIDLTGAARLGGDWMLEYATGTIEAISVLDASADVQFEAVLQDVPANALNAAATFTISDARVIVTPAGGGGQLDNVPFLGLFVPLDLKGGAAADSFVFTGAPGLGNNLANSTIDGGGGANSINVSGISDDFVFEINQIDAGANGNTKSAIKTETLIGTTPFFPNIRNVQTFKGGRLDNNFKFLANFAGAPNDMPVTIDASASANNNHATNTLDFSQKALALKIAVTNAGLLTVSNNNIALVTTATKIDKVINRAANDATLDLSGFNNAETLTLTIKADQTVKVSFNNQTLVEASQVGTLILGQGKNILKIEANGSIPIISLPGNGNGQSDANGLNTRVELDYSAYGAPATVNKGAAIDLRAGQGATLTVDPVNNNNNAAADWRTETWRLTPVDNAGNAPFTFGSDDTATNVHNHQNIDLNAPNNNRQALEDILGRLAGVPVVSVAAGANDAFFDVTVASNAAEDAAFPAFGSPNSVASFALGQSAVANDQLQFSSNATAGTFKLKVFVNGANVPTAAINLEDARLNPTIIETAIQLADNLANLDATVTGHGTDLDPWVITLQNGVFQAEPVDSTALTRTGDAKIRLERRAQNLNTTRPNWNLSIINAVAGGKFKLSYTIDNQTRTTRAIPFDAPNSLIEKALEELSDDFIVRVEDGNAGVTHDWKITIAHKTKDSAKLRASTLAIFEPTNVLVNSATGMGAGRIANLVITKITGSGHAGDEFFVSNNAVNDGNNPAETQWVEIVDGNADAFAAGTGAGDVLTGGSRSDTASGGGLQDHIRGGGHGDVLLGGSGSDRLLGEAGNDWLFGGDDDDKGAVNFLQGPLMIPSPPDFPTGVNDVPQGAGLSGGPGDDFIDGGGGSDYLDGGNNVDTIHGGSGEDELRGGAGNDMLFGDGDNDTLFGHTGTDRLDGGAGNDLLQGEADSDTYVFSTADWGRDRVVEANGGGDRDIVDLSKLSTDLTVNILSADTGKSQFTVIRTDSVGNNAHAIGRDYAAGAATAPQGVSHVEVIKGGQARNNYLVDAAWSGTIEIDDSANSANGILDLANVTDNLSVTIDFENGAAGGRVKIVVTKTDTANNADQITAYDVDWVRLGNSENRLKFLNDAMLPGSFLPPVPPGADYKVFWDLSSDVMDTNLGATVNLSVQNAPVLLATPFMNAIVRTHHAEVHSTQSVWQMSAVNNNLTRKFTLTFGDRADGALTTKTIDLARAGSTPQNEIMLALAALPTVRSAMVAGGGTNANPWVITIRSEIGAEPILSSAKHAISSLNAVEAGTSILDPANAGNTVQVRQQAVSLFTEASTSKDQTLALRLRSNAGLTAQFNVVFSGNDKSAAALATAIRGSASFLNANDLISVTGAGSHHDPWLVNFANATTWKIDSIVLANSVLKSTGSVHLQQTTVGTAGSAGHTELYLRGPEAIAANLPNPAVGGHFVLTLTRDPAGAAVSTNKTFPHNVSAKALEEWIEEQADFMANGEEVAVSGEGSSDNPWEFEVEGKRIAAGMFHEFEITVAAVVNEMIANRIPGIQAALWSAGIDGIITGPDRTLIISDVGFGDPQNLTSVDTITTADVVNSTNTVYGGLGNNTLVGNRGKDILDGGVGNDTIQGGGNEDVLSGGVGDDKLDGGAEADSLSGGDGDDELKGGDGDDKLDGGAGSDTLDGGAGEDVLFGGEKDYDKLEGGTDNDTFVFEDDWGYDVVTEADQIGGDSKDVLDFSAVSEPVTHILTNGTLVSGTGDYTLAKPQDELRGLNPLNVSNGNVGLRNVFGFDNMQTPNVGAASSVSGHALTINSLKAFKSDQTFRMLLARGASSPELVTLSLTKAEIDGLADLNALSTLLNNKLTTASVDDAATVDLSNDASFSVEGVLGTEFLQGLKLTLSGASMSVQVLAMDHSVLAGTSLTTSQLQRFEQIKAANADNTFIFGDDWGEYGILSAIPGISGNPLGAYEPDLATGLANFFGKNRTLEIEVEKQTGNRTILDFRQVTKILAFNFFKAEDGTITLEIEREEQWNYPFAKIPFDTPIWRFNNIEITNIDENTIIYTGRKENLLRIGKDIDLRATIIGGSGLAPIQTLASLGEVFESVIAGRLWSVTASNLIDYTRFGFIRNTATDLGGGTLTEFASDADSSRFQQFLGAAIGAINPFPVHVDPDLGLGWGNTDPQIANVGDGTLINLFSVRNAGLGLTYSAGTHVSPLRLATGAVNLVSSSLANAIGGVRADDYISHVPDEFRQYVGLGEAYGLNNLNVGVGNLEKQLIDSAFAKNILKLAGWLPGIHLLEGLTGPDNYNFAGWWGAAFVLEPPDFQIGAEGENFVPTSIDTLDFSKVKSDLYVTIVGSGLLGDLGPVELGIDENLVFVTPYDPRLLSDEDLTTQVLSGFGNILPISGAYNKVQDIQENDVASNQAQDVLSFLEADGGIVVATGIESIVGGSGTLTVSFRGGINGAVPQLDGRITGEEVVLDYSNIAPQNLPPVAGGGTRVGLDVDLGTAAWAFDPVLGTANSFENGVNFFDAIFDFETSTEYRESLSKEITAWLPRLEAIFGRADLVSGGHDLSIIDNFVAYFDTGKALEFLSHLDVTNVFDVAGTSGNDILKGNDEANLFVGMGGIDTVDGREGADVFSFSKLENLGDEFDEPVTFVMFDDEGGEEDTFFAWTGSGRDDLASDEINTTDVERTAPANRTTLIDIEGVAGGTGNDLFLGEARDDGFDASLTIVQPGSDALAEQQRIGFSGDKGTISLSWNGLLTGSLSYDASASPTASVAIDETHAGKTGVNAIQEIAIRADGGSFTLSYNDAPTESIDFNASASDVQTALDLIAELNGNVSVTGGDGLFMVEFVNNLAETSVSRLVAGASELTLTTDGAFGYAIADALNGLKKETSSKQAAITGGVVVVTDANVSDDEHAWIVTFGTNGAQPQIRINEGRSNTYHVINNWGDDLIIDQGGANTIDFKFFEGTITHTVVDALRQSGGAGGVITTSTSNDADTSTITAGFTADDGQFMLLIDGEQVEPIAYSSDVDTLVASIQDALDAFYSESTTVATVTPTSIEPVAGDYNENGIIDAADYTVWRDTLGQSVTPGSGADGDGSGIIDQGDYAVWKSNFGKTPVTGDVAVEIVFSGGGSPEELAEKTEVRYYDDVWNYITKEEGSGTGILTAVGAFELDINGREESDFIVESSKPSDTLSKTGSGLAASAETGIDAPAPLLTEAALAPIIVEAAARWGESSWLAASGFDLSAIDVQIADLSGNTLGQTDGQTVFLDVDAAGRGWFIDATPSLDNEFTIDLAGGVVGSDLSSAATGDIDLLTVVMHELGHMIGLADLSVAAQAGDLMFSLLDAGVRKSVPEFNASRLHDGPVAGASHTNDSDQEIIESGLTSFGNWISNAGHLLDNIFGDVPQIPFTNQSIIDVLGLDDLNGTLISTADQLSHKIDTLRDVITGVFDANSVVTTQMIVDASDDIHHTFSSNLKEFRGTVELASFQEDIVLDFSIGGLGDFGLEVDQSTPIVLTGELDLDFVFGLDEDGHFFVSDPTIFGRLKLNHDAPLDISLSVGPLGIGIEDGLLDFEVGLGLGTDGRLDFDTLTGDPTGSLLGDFSLDSDASFNINLPIELQGALAGLQNDPALISGSYNGNDAGESSLSEFFGALGSTLASADFGDLFDFKDISLDVVLDGIIAGLNALVGVDVSQQSLSHNAASGSFILSFDGRTTESFDVQSVNGQQIADALTALTDLPNFPDGATVTLSGGDGSEMAPWTFDVSAPGNVTIIQQIAAIAGSDLVDANGAPAKLSVATTGNHQDSLAYRELPFVNKSLVDMLGDGSVNVIEQIKNALVEVRSTLSDIQSFEIDVNFALDNALQLHDGQGAAVDFGGSKAVLKAALEVLRAVSPGLHSGSTNFELAMALAESFTSDAFDARVDDLRLIISSNRLAELGTSASANSGTAVTVDGNSTDAEIATAVALATEFTSYSALIANRDILLNHQEFVDALQDLVGLGFNEDSTSDDIIAALRTNPTDQARSNLELLKHGDTPEDGMRSQLGMMLISLGVLPDTWQSGDAIPAATDSVVTDLEDADESMAVNALALLQASYDLADKMLDGRSTDAEIEATLTDSDEIAAAKKNRDTLSNLLGSILQEQEAAKALLRSKGLIGDNPTQAELQAITDDQVVTAFFNETQVNDTLADLTTVQQADPATIAANDALSAVGLTAESNDLSFAAAVNDPDVQQSYLSDRDRLSTATSTLGEATDRLTKLGFIVGTLDPDLEVATDDEIGMLAEAFASADLLGPFDDARNALAASDEMDLAASTDLAVINALAQLSPLGVNITRAQSTVAAVPNSSNEISVLHDAVYGTLTLGFGSANQQETIVVEHDADAAFLETQLEELTLFDDVTVTVDIDSPGQSGWVIKFVTPNSFSISDVSVVENHLLAGQASDVDLAAAILSADVNSVAPMYLSDVIGAVDALTARGLSSTSTAAELAAVTSQPSTYADMLAAKATLSTYDDHKIITLSYQHSQLFVGFKFSASGGVDFDLSVVEDFLHNDINLPDAVTVDTEGSIHLAGDFAIDFALGVDLGSLEDGITLDELFIQLNDLTITGELETENFGLQLGYGPLIGSIDGAAIDLNAGVRFNIDNNGSPTASLADFRDQGFSTLINVEPTAATLDAELPVSVSLHGTTAAQTTLSFSTDNLFAEVQNLISQLPSLDDIANLSIDQILNGIKSAVDFIEKEALAHPDTVAAMPLINEYLDTALADIRAALAFVKELQGSQSQTLWSDGHSGTVQLQFEGDDGQFMLDFGDGSSPVTASDVKSAIDALSLGYSVDVTGDGTADSPWKISFSLTNDAGSVDVPSLIVVEPSSLVNVNGAAATVTILPPDAQTLSHDVHSGALTLQLKGDAESFTLDFGDAANPLTVAAADLRDMLAKLETIQDLGRTVEVTGTGTSLDPWQVRYANYELSHNAVSGNASLQLLGETDAFLLDIDANGPITASQLQAGLAGLTYVASRNLSVEVTGDGTSQSPWEIAFADADGGFVQVPELVVAGGANSLVDDQGVAAAVVFNVQYDSSDVPDLVIAPRVGLWHDGASGSAELMLGDDSTMVTINAGSNAQAVETGLEGVPTVASLIGPTGAVAVTGSGTAADPWQIVLTKSNGIHVAVPTITVVTNGLIDADGAEATVAIKVSADQPADLLTDAEAAATVSITSPTANNVAKELGVAERFLERVLGVDESEFLLISHDAQTGDGSVTLNVDGAAEDLVVTHDMDALQLQALLQNSASFNPNAYTVNVEGTGTVDDPWKVRMTNADGDNVDAPTLVVASTTLVDEDGKNAVFTIETDRQEHIDLLLDGTAVVVDLGKDFAFGDDNFAFQFDLRHLADQLDDDNPFKGALTQVGDLAQLAASGVVDLEVVGRIDFKVGFNFAPTETLGTAIWVSDDSQVTMDVLLDAEDLEFDVELNVDEALQELPPAIQDVFDKILDGTSIGTVGFHVIGGSIAVNSGLDDTGALQPAHFHFSFVADDQDTGETGSGDGRYGISELAGNLVPQNAGNLLVDLPLFFPTAELPMGGTEEDRDGNGVADNTLQVEVTDFNNVHDSLVVSTPHFANSISLFSLLENINTVAVVAGEAEGRTVWTDATGGTIQLKFEGDADTDFFAIDLSQDAATILANLKAEIEALSSVAGHSPTVEVVVGGSGTETDPWTIEFVHNSTDNSFGFEVSNLVYLSTSSVSENDVTVGSTLDFSNPFEVGILGTIEDILRGDLFGINLAFIGNKLDAAADKFAEFRGDVHDALQKVAVEADDSGLIAVVQQGLFDLLGPSGLNLLTEADFKIDPDTGMTELTKDDILVTGDTRTVQFDLRISDPELVQASVGIDFAAAIPGLGVSIDNPNTGEAAEIDLTIGYSFSFGFGLSFDDGFYFDVSSANELEFDVAANLGNGFEAKAQIGFLELDVIDNLVEDFEGNMTGSGLFGKFFVDLHEPTTANGNGRLSLGEMGGDMIDAGFVGKAAANLGATLSIEGDIGKALPKISTDFYFEQMFGIGSGAVADPQSGSSSFGTAPIIEFRDVELNLSSFLSGILGPAFDTIDSAIKPIKPIIDILDTPLPAVSQLAGKDITFLTLASAFGGGDAKPFIQALELVVDAVEFIDNLESSSEDIMVKFGTFKVGGASHDMRMTDAQGMALNSLIDAPQGGSASSFDESALHQSINGQGTQGKNTGSFLSKIKNSGIALPFVTNPSQVFSLLAGDFTGIDFFQWDIPKLFLGFEMRESYPIFPGLNAFFGGAIGIVVDFTFGYDSAGIDRYMNTKQVGDLFRGLYILDAIEPDGSDPDEVTFEIIVDAGASVGISGLVEAGVEGGLEAKVGFDLNNPPENTDHKFRYTDFIDIIETAPQALFDADGEFDIFVDAFLWVGLNLGFSKVTIFDARFEFLRETLFSFHYHSAALDPPTLATQSGNVLHLNTGNRSVDRVTGDTSDTSEKYSVSLISAPDANDTSQTVDYLQVTAFGHSQGSYIEGNANTHLFRADEIATIMADGGLGDDAFTIGTGNMPLTQAVVLTGGADNDSFDIFTTGDVTIEGKDGDDRINVSTTPGAVTIDGDAGNDAIDVSAIAAGSPILIRTGDDDDTVKGSIRSDLIFGGAGDDKIDGGDGVDFLFGGTIQTNNTSGKPNADDLTFAFGDTQTEIVAGASSITHIADSGSDVLLGGNGADALFGGNEDGGDTILGGAGGDVIFAGSGDDTVSGDDAEDSGGNDIIYAGAGADRVHGDAGDDEIHGEAGDDDISGGLGADTVYGGNDDDIIRWTRALMAQEGDTLVNLGDEGADALLDGEGGNDLLVVTGDDSDESVTVAQAMLSGSPASGVAATWTDGSSLAVQGMNVENLSLDLAGGADDLTVEDLTTSGIVGVTIDLGTEAQTLAAVPFFERFFDVSLITPSSDDDDPLLANSKYALLDGNGDEAIVSINLVSVVGGNQGYSVSHTGVLGSFLLTNDDDASGGAGLIVAHDALADDVAAAVERLIDGAVTAVSGDGTTTTPWVVEVADSAAITLPSLSASVSGNLPQGGVQAT
ncbi:DUF4347 domain-containing protein, partial [Pirellulales bacterium]|nr:DUF4347 domain-containing protein [Pirellulales bacterium]